MLTKGTWGLCPIECRSRSIAFPIAVSQRSHQDSDKPSSGYQVENFASDAVKFLNALEIDRAVLVGHSGSCLVARNVALGHPQRVTGQVSKPPTNLGTDAARHFVQSVVLDLADPIEPDFARSFVADSSPANVTPELVDHVLRCHQSPTDDRRGLR